MSDKKKNQFTLKGNVKEIRGKSLVELELINTENDKLISDAELKSKLLREIKDIFTDNVYSGNKKQIQKQNSLTLEELKQIADILKIEVK